jgi:hypothetical protein
MRTGRVAVAEVAEANNDKKSAQKGHKSEVDTSALCAHPAVLASTGTSKTLPDVL